MTLQLGMANDDVRSKAKLWGNKKKFNPTVHAWRDGQYCDFPEILKPEYYHILQLFCTGILPGDSVVVVGQLLEEIVIQVMAEADTKQRYSSVDPRFDVVSNFPFICDSHRRIAVGQGDNCRQDVTSAL